MRRNEIEVARPGETVVWEGRGAAGRDTMLSFPLAAAALAGVLVGFSALYDGNLALGIPLFAYGAYWYARECIYEPLRRRHVRYVLTLDHAYLVYGWPRARTKAVDLRRIGPSSLRRHADGTATITFGQSPNVERLLAVFAIQLPAFRHIEHAEALMPVIRGESEFVILASDSFATRMARMELEDDERDEPGSTRLPYG